MQARIALCAFALLAASCSKGGDSGATQPVATVASVSVSQDATLVPLATVQLTATPKDASGAALAGKAVTWSSGNAAIASVSVTGLVTAAAVGTAIISATSEGKSGSATMTVLDGGVVGAAGGTVTALNGAVKLTVPAGALSASTAITVAVSTIVVTDGRIVPGTVYEIGPSGTQLGAGATLALTYDPTKVRPIDQQTDLRLFTTDATGKWVPVNASGTGSADGTANVVTGPLPHLSPFALASTSAVQTITSATIGTLPNSPAFSNSLQKLATVSLFAATTNAFGQPAAPQGTPQVTSSDVTKITVSNVAKATGGSQGVTFALNGVDVGTANITLTVDGQTLSIPVTVPQGPSMTIALSPSTLSTAQGTAATGSSQVTITKNFTAPVTLSYTSSSLSNLTGSFTPSVVPSTSSSSSLSVGASSFLAPGSYAMTITASSTPPGASVPVLATATYTATVTTVAGSATIASADPGKPVIAMWMRPMLGGAWSTMTCTNNACPFTYDPTAVALSFAIVQSLGAGAYHDYVVSVSGDEVPYLPAWFAGETEATTTATWPGTNLASGSTFAGFIGSRMQSATMPIYTLNFPRAPLGNQEVSGVLSSSMGIKYYYLPGRTNITAFAALPSIDLSQAGVAPVMKTLTYSDPLNYPGTPSWTAIWSNLDGSGFAEKFNLPFTGTTIQFPYVPPASLPGDLQQGLAVQLVAPDGSERECKQFVRIIIDLNLQLGPNVGSLSYVQGTSGATTLDYGYMRQPAYNLKTEISQRDLTGLYKVDFVTTGLYNLGRSPVNLTTSDLPSKWWLYNAPNYNQVNFKFKAYGLVGATPGAASALRGPQASDTWIVGRSIQYSY